MAWPGGPIDTTDTDAGTDSPATARTDLLDCLQKVNTIIAARDQASGIPSLDANSKVPQTELPKVKRFVDGTPGSGKTWAVPAGVYRVRRKAVGGGAGGGYTTVGTGGDHGGGGGAGGIVEDDVDVLPGSSFNYTVGSHGAGHANSSDGNGTDGGDSTCTSPASATPSSDTITGGGGRGGEGPPNRFGGGGGQPTAPSGNALTLPGGAGQSGGARGGMGGANSETGGNAGSLGYGGGGGFGSGGGTPGFDGLDGYVSFEWRE